VGDDAGHGWRPVAFCHGKWLGDRVRHDVGQVRREVFYFRSGPDLLYASLYRRIRPTTALRLLVCPSWGMEGKQLLQWCHQLARGVSDLGGTGLVVEWPGFEDSEGDPQAVAKLQRLAARDSYARGELGR
jgi:hypothetical protein